LHHLNGAKLKLINQYIIPLKGLKDGEHKFEFALNDKFFEKHEVLEAHSGEIIAKVILTKKTQLLTLKTGINGFLEIQCDRCLEFFNFPVNYNGNLVVRLSEKVDESTDEIWVVHPNEYELNMEQYFFECIGLSIPLQKVHQDNQEGNPGCNPDMLEIIKTYSVSFDKNEEETDPRWNKLKELLNNKNINN
jgi:uncharacterized metal-binding protein YceD (DUF177 family)